MIKPGPANPDAVDWNWCLILIMSSNAIYVRIVNHQGCVNQVETSR